MSWVALVPFSEICIPSSHTSWKMTSVYWMFLCIFCTAARKSINKKSFTIVVSYGLHTKCLLNLHLLIISKFKIRIQTMNKNNFIPSLWRRWSHFSCSCLKISNSSIICIPSESVKTSLRMSQERFIKLALSLLNLRIA